MTTVNITLPTRIIKALEPLTAKSDPRRYLSGISFTRTSDRVLRLAATNGHVIGILAHTLTDDEDSLPGFDPFILPASILSAFKHTQASLKLDMVIAIESVPGDNPEAPPRRILTATQGNTAATATLDDTRYPDYMQVIPKSDDVLSPDRSAPWTQFDPKYMTVFHVVANRLKDSREAIFLLHPTSEAGSAVVTIPGHPGFLGVFMPIVTPRKDQTDLIQSAYAAIDAPLPEPESTATPGDDDLVL